MVTEPNAADDLSLQSMERMVADVPPTWEAVLKSLGYAKIKDGRDYEKHCTATRFIRAYPGNSKDVILMIYMSNNPVTYFRVPRPSSKFEAFVRILEEELSKPLGLDGKDDIYVRVCHRIPKVDLDDDPVDESMDPDDLSPESMEQMVTDVPAWYQPLVDRGFSVRMRDGYKPELHRDYGLFSVDIRNLRSTNYEVRAYHEYELTADMWCTQDQVVHLVNLIERELNRPVGTDSIIHRLRALHHDWTRGDLAAINDRVQGQEDDLREAVPYRDPNKPLLPLKAGVGVRHRLAVSDNPDEEHVKALANGGWIKPQPLPKGAQVKVRDERSRYFGEVGTVESSRFDSAWVKFDDESIRFPLEHLELVQYRQESKLILVDALPSEVRVRLAQLEEAANPDDFDLMGYAHDTVDPDKALGELGLRRTIPVSAGGSSMIQAGWELRTPKAMFYVYSLTDRAPYVCQMFFPTERGNGGKYWCLSPQHVRDAESVQEAVKIIRQWQQDVASGLVIESQADLDDPEAILRGHKRQLSHVLYSDGGEGRRVYMVTASSVDKAVEVARNLELFNDAKHVWIEQYEQFPHKQGEWPEIKPTGLVWDLTPDYKPWARVQEAVDVDDPESFLRSYVRTWYVLRAMPKRSKRFGDAVYYSTSFTLEEATAYARKRHLMAPEMGLRAWISEYAEPEHAPGVFVDTEATGRRWDIMPDYTLVARVSKIAESEEPTASEITAAAEKAEPPKSPEHAEAGNYPKGHLHLYGLDITIENARGQERSGVDKGGKKWSVEMPAHYGYIKGTTGKDGDHVDVYIGEDPASDKVWVVDQLDAESGKFDEHKCLLAFPSKAKAEETYLAGFSDGKGKERLGGMTEMTVAEFKEWAHSEETDEPLAESDDLDDLRRYTQAADQPWAWRKDPADFKYEITFNGKPVDWMGNEQSAEFMAGALNELWNTDKSWTVNSWETPSNWYWRVKWGRKPERTSPHYWPSRRRRRNESSDPDDFDMDAYAKEAYNPDYMLRSLGFHPGRPGAWDIAIVGKNNTDILMVVEPQKNYRSGNIYWNIEVYLGVPGSNTMEVRAQYSGKEATMEQIRVYLAKIIKRFYAVDISDDSVHVLAESAEEADRNFWCFEADDEPDVSRYMDAVYDVDEVFRQHGYTRRMRGEDDKALIKHFQLPQSIYLRSDNLKREIKRVYVRDDSGDTLVIGAVIEPLAGVANARPMYCSACGIFLNPAKLNNIDYNLAVSVRRALVRIDAAMRRIPNFNSKRNLDKWLADMAKQVEADVERMGANAVEESAAKAVVASKLWETDDEFDLSSYVNTTFDIEAELRQHGFVHGPRSSRNNVLCEMYKSYPMPQTYTVGQASYDQMDVGLIFDPKSARDWSNSFVEVYFSNREHPEVRFKVGNATLLPILTGQNEYGEHIVDPNMAIRRFLGKLSTFVSSINWPKAPQAVRAAAEVQQALYAVEHEHVDESEDLDDPEATLSRYSTPEVILQRLGYVPYEQADNDLPDNPYLRFVKTIELNPPVKTITRLVLPRATIHVSYKQNDPGHPDPWRCVIVVRAQFSDNQGRIRLFSAGAGFQNTIAMTEAIQNATAAIEKLLNVPGGGSDELYDMQERFRKAEYGILRPPRRIESQEDPEAWLKQNLPDLKTGLPVDVDPKYYTRIEVHGCKQVGDDVEVDDLDSQFFSVYLRQRLGNEAEHIKDFTTKEAALEYAHRLEQDYKLPLSIPPVWTRYESEEPPLDPEAWLKQQLPSMQPGLPKHIDPKNVDAIEIHGLNAEGDDVWQDDEDPLAFGVYLHLINPGGIDDTGKDYDTLAEAVAYAEHLHRAYGWPVYNYCAE